VIFGLHECTAVYAPVDTKISVVLFAEKKIFAYDSDVDGVCKCINVVIPMEPSLIFLISVTKLASTEKVRLEKVRLALP